jgi:hypothetical protein
VSTREGRRCVCVIGEEVLSLESFVVVVVVVVVVDVLNLGLF